jgi:hemoglobin/transferrin/lactoferrin receptor protein
MALVTGTDGVHAAQLETYRLDGLTVTARGVATPASLTPGGVGVVSSEDLREQGGASVVETLERIPGVSRSNDSPWSADIIIRGMARDSVVLLVDGMRVNMTTDINGRFGLVPEQQIERIEVLKGPVSALYGSGSVGGVVNIITKGGHFTETSQWHGGAGVTAGSNPAGGTLSANLGYSTSSTWVSGSVSSRDHNDYLDGDGHTTDNSQFSDISGTLAAGLKWSDEHQTRFDLACVEASDVGVPGTGTAPLPVGAHVTLTRNTSKRMSVTHSYTPKDSPLQESSLRLGYQLIERNPRIDDFPSGAVLWIEPWADHETVSGDWRNRFALGDHGLTVGVEAWNWYMTGGRERGLKNGKILADNPTPRTTQFSAGVYAEDDWRLAPRWIVNVGGRIDQLSIDNEATPLVKEGSRDDVSWAGHVGLTHVLTTEWNLTGLVASSYRTPNILELFKNISLGGGITEVGNPDLDPEQSLFFEAGAHYGGNTLAVDLSAYANFVDDLIVSDLVSPTLYMMNNVAKAEVYGAEVAAQWDVAVGWELFGNLAYTRGRDVESGEELRFIPPLNGLAGLRQTLVNGFWWSAETQWFAGQHETPEEVDSSSFYATLNARCGLGFEASGLHHDLGLSINNLLDRQYHNYLATSRGVELMEPGINVVGSWNVSF